MTASKDGARSLGAPDKFAVAVTVPTGDPGMHIEAHVSGAFTLDPARAREPAVHSVELDARAMLSARERLPAAVVDAAVTGLLQALETSDVAPMRVIVSLGGRSSVEWGQSMRS